MGYLLKLIGIKAKVIKYPEQEEEDDVLGIWNKIKRRVKMGRFLEAIDKLLVSILGVSIVEKRKENDRRKKKQRKRKNERRILPRRK